MEPTTPSPKPMLDIGREIQFKLAFYLVALAFTILGLSIQTAEFRDPIMAALLEVGAWLLLFVSGLAGLMRLELAPHHLFKLHEAETTGRHDLKTLQMMGKRVALRYQVHKWTLVVGLLLLICARAWYAFV